MPPRTRPLALVLAATLVLAACGDSPTDPPEVEDPVATLDGRVEMVGGSLPEGVQMVAQWGIVEARAAVEADGRLSLPLAQKPSTPGFLGVQPPGEGGIVPALIRLEDPLVPEELRIVVLPDTWIIRRGTHAGTEVPVRPASAGGGGVYPAYWGFTFPVDQAGRRQTVVDSTRWSGALVTWPGDAFPLPVALDREASDPPFAAADSARLWTGLDALEAALGRDLFRPVPRSELPATEDGGRVPGAVLVRLDSTLTLRGRAGVDSADPDWVRIESVGAWSGSEVTRLAVVSSDARAGWMRFGASQHLEDAGLVMHEAMHVLGVGHGCSWPSLQTYCESLTAGAPTADDVAHLEVLEAARAAEKALDTRLGILPAVFGDRALRLGLPPVPGVVVVPPGEG